MKNSPCDTCVRPGRMTGNICIYEAECEKYHAWLRNTQEQKINELKPCPFCGSNNLGTYQAELGGAIVYCIDCYENNGNNYTSRQPIYEWNTRPIEDGLNVRIEELEKTITT